MNLWVIFITGLTTGGLTCLAVQGGLLATALSRQTTVAQPKYNKGKHRRTTAQSNVTGVQMAQNPLPVVYFLVAKLVAYTALGFLLGALGSVFKISATVQGILQIGAALFMVATALNMLNVHPIFRYAAIQPPRFITKMVRNQAKSQEVFTPLLLGALTVLIPCGTTQAMEVLAISSGNAFIGAAVMFIFILGTSPMFFVLGFLATQIRGQLQKPFVMLAATLILILGVVSLDAGMNLLGSPLAPRRVIASLFEATGGKTSLALAKEVDGVQEVTIDVVADGYAPNLIQVKRGQPIRLRLLTNQTFSCARAFTIPSLKIDQLLPETGETVIELPAQQPGSVYFTCSMGMYSGLISVV